MEFLFFLFGLGLLTVGAHILVVGASHLALRFGVSSIIVGLTVVALGTSSPEAAVSISAARQGVPDIAIGNVVGSNIVNILLILGASALLHPLKINRQILRFDGPIMLVVTIVFWGMATDGAIGLADSLLLCAGLFLYLGTQIEFGRRQFRKTTIAEIVGDDLPNDSVEDSGKPFSIPVSLISIAGGLILLALGSNLLIEAAVSFARYLGVNELVIGLTIVATGTSLPELATSVVAACKREHDIALGNIIGSNILNILFVLSATGLFSVNKIVPVQPNSLSFDFPVLCGVTVGCLVLIYFKRRVSPLAGAALLFGFALYTAARLGAG